MPASLLAIITTNKKKSKIVYDFFYVKSGKRDDVSPDVTPEASRMCCQPLGDGDEGKGWSMGLPYPHLLGKTPRKRCFTLVICEAVVMNTTRI